jgi:MoaA/NifB/PqqE/SkfB family radical SAM enzyme
MSSLNAARKDIAPEVSPCGEKSQNHLSRPLPPVKGLVTPFERMKILGMYSEAKRIREGKIPYPRMAIVYPTYVCNHNCQDCLYGEWNRSHHVIMDARRFPELVDALVSLRIKAVEFSGGGEPTLHPNFTRLVCLLANEGLEMGLLTNGTMIRGETLEAVVNHFTYIRISIDGHTPELFDLIRRPSAAAGLERVVENIRALREARDRAGSPLTIGAKVLLSRLNYGALVEMVRFCREAGLDYVQFKPLRNSPHSLGPSEVETANYILAGIKANTPGIMVYGGATGSSYAGKCWLTPIHVVVDPLGDMYPCCYYQYRADRMLLGNLFEHPVEKVWFGPRHMEVLQGLRVEECNLYDCRWHLYNQIMDEILDQNRLHVNFI